MITILDGGMGRELKARGAPFRQPEWSALALMDAPEMVRDAHAAFAAAGAEVLTVNAYALVPFHIGAARFAAEGEALAALAGRLAREAAGPGIRVAGCLPPLFGSYRPDLFRAEQAPALLAPLIRGQAPFVDLWLAETLGSIAEAQAVAAALAAAGEGARPLWLSFTLADEDPAVAPVLRSGEPVAAALQAALAAGAEALLFNCCQPEVIGPALRAVAAGAAGRLRLGAYANAFPPMRKDAAANEALSDLRADLDPAQYLDVARGWAEEGAEILGGCCGIGPEHIRRLATLRG